MISGPKVGTHHHSIWHRQILNSHRAEKEEESIFGIGNINLNLRGGYFRVCHVTVEFFHISSNMSPLILAVAGGCRTVHSTLCRVNFWCMKVVDISHQNLFDFLANFINLILFHPPCLAILESSSAVL